ncbi:hypothetical protein OIU79_011160 [Salix purpurea]|uniref:Uncharacterized protein n=1 Tax=Salix purpurea TaxID=77065 RepID=A0A9Q0TAN4_SALPP|nr:hypothetical protein OIU79_011160 [Salix purpurea]
MFAGIADDSSGAKNGAGKTDMHAASTSNTGIPKIAIIFVSMVAIGFLAFFLFKFWQKKKREEQHARLLKLFEEDDELEAELGRLKEVCSEEKLLLCCQDGAAVIPRVEEYASDELGTS